MSTKVYFFTGKGGVGKSTLAASFARRLAQDNKRPVLIVDANGPGTVFRKIDSKLLEIPNQKIFCVSNQEQLYGCLILPKPSFREYFGMTLNLGGGGLSSRANQIKEKLLDGLFENKVVAAFVDVCPGLEPSVLVGKIYHEATSGRDPLKQQPWGSIVVDAPATGHGIMMFKSLFALVDIFKAGPIATTSQKLRDFFLNPNFFKVFIVSHLSEHPLAEAEVILKETQRLGFSSLELMFNRVMPNPKGIDPSRLSEEWKKVLPLFEEDYADQEARRLDFETKHLRKGFIIPDGLKHLELAEHFKGISL
jgi:anion-transporting  ArsA/GET3 family ATPase